MADDGSQIRAAEGEENGVPPPNRGLQDFITEQYEQQKAAGAMQETAELDEARMANFFNRALAESQRMNHEIQKSKGKLAALKAEFGEEMISAWREEHAAEVLTEPQREAVRHAEQGSFS